MNNYYEKQEGFIALVSAIIISIVLLGVVLTGGLTGFFTRLNIFDTESKEKSYALASACIDLATLEYINNGAIIAGVKTAGTGECEVVSWNDVGKNLTILTSAAAGNAFTNLRVEISTDEMNILEWQECGNLSNC